MISVIVYISIVLYMMMDIYELNCWCNSYPIAIINLLDVSKLHNTSIFLFTMNYLALKRKTASFVLLLNMLLQDQFANKPRLWIRLSRTSISKMRPLLIRMNIFYLMCCYYIITKFIRSLDTFISVFSN
jgi:hypothetical protein